MALQLTRRRFTTADYHRMVEAGVLSEDDRVELIDGEILEMSPIGSQQAACVDRLNRLFSRRVGDAAIVRVQSPVHLDERSEPQPDLALLRPRADFYAAGHPTPQEVWLVVEVADTSAEFERQVKAALYARAGIPELWLVDLTQRRITVYQDAAPTGYVTVRVLRPGDTLHLAGVPALGLPVADVLG